MKEVVKILIFFFALQ